MMPLTPVKIILIGFVLVLSGAVVPFLMMIKVIPPGFLLSFLSYGASITGLFLGLLGAALYIHRTKD